MVFKSNKIEAFIWFVSLSLLFFGCQNDSVGFSLENGLKDYKKIRNINESFVPGYTFEKVAYFKINDSTYKFAVKLNNDISKKMVSAYGIRVLIYINEKHLENRQNKMIITDLKPDLEIIGGYKYMTKLLSTNVKRLDSVEFYLCDRDKYRKILGNSIRIKNIGL